jgi:hypothetical protein
VRDVLLEVMPLGRGTAEWYVMFFSNLIDSGTATNLIGRQS